jgi:ABC-2 type transport system permease protein
LAISTSSPSPSGCGAALRAEVRTDEEQNLISDLFERVVLYDLKVTEPTAVQRADGKWDVTVPVEAKKYEVDRHGVETENARRTHRSGSLHRGAAPRRLRREERDRHGAPAHPLWSTGPAVRDRPRPDARGYRSLHYYIDRNSGDNVRPVVNPE